jgi:hypothetical protein
MSFEENVVCGSVFDLTDNVHLGIYDLVINYVLIKDGTVDDNARFAQSLLRFCESRKIPQLIHISSISCYGASARIVTESSLIETKPSRKGSYGALKVIADQVLHAKRPDALRITYVRPGFILGEGMVSPIIGMAFRCGKNLLLQVGSSTNVLPITTRRIVNEAVCRLCRIAQQEAERVVLIADRNSPTRHEWLSECCHSAGGGRVAVIPVWLWKLAGLGGEAFAKMAGLKLSPWTIVQNACRSMRFLPQASENYLGMSFECEWKKELRHSLENQDSMSNFAFVRPDKKALKTAKRVTFIGFGGIVKQRHLGAIKALGFEGQVEAYDLIARKENGQDIRNIDSLQSGSSDLWVVATPGHVHHQAIPLLSQTTGPVLIEKPLCCSPSEYEAWLLFAEKRPSKVLVCHNYRYKQNMGRFYDHLQRHVPGKLLHVHLEFQSPPVSMDSAAWRKHEREARTLLMDYALHFLDIACMFQTDKWDVITSEYSLNRNGETAFITGVLASPMYRVSFVLRQGFQPRRCRLFFTFQNYGVSLGFFPDTFVPHMTDDSAGPYAIEAKASRQATFSKIVDKLTKRNSDFSHATLLGMIANNDHSKLGVEVNKLQAFYSCLFELCNRIYVKGSV